MNRQYEEDMILEMITDGFDVETIVRWIHDHSNAFPFYNTLETKDIENNVYSIMKQVYDRYSTENEEYGLTESERKMEESIYDFDSQNRPMYRFAKKKHDDTGAIRKHSGDPYWVHPEGVAKIAKAFGGDDIEVQAALAHDTVEDTGATIEEITELFGTEVAEVVSEITNDKEGIARLGKEQYMNEELCNLSHPALFVKLCDMYYNMEDYPVETQKARMIRNLNYLLEYRKDLEDRELDLIEGMLGKLL